MTQKKGKKAVYKDIPLKDIIEPSGALRLEVSIDTVKELAKSIEDQGLLQAIGVVVRGDKYEIVYGHRRFLAHKLLERKTIHCRIIERSDKEIKLARAVENIGRKNLSPLEEGAVCLDLRETLGLTIEQIAKAIGMGPSAVKRRLHVLNMPDTFQRALHEGKIKLGVAEALWACPDPTQREYFLELAVEHGITTTIARQWVSDWKKSLRASDDAPGGEADMLSPMEATIQYSSCSLCGGPIQLTHEKYFRCCPDCADRIFSAIKKTRG